MIDVGSLTWTDLRRGLAVQSRIITALILREMRTRFGEMQFGYAWALIEPLAQIGVLVFVFTLVGRHPPIGTSYESFFLTGYVTYGLFRQISGRAAQSITANRALLSFPPVRNMDTVWARILLETATGLTAFLMVTAIFGYLGAPVVPHDFLQYLAGFASVLALSWGFGLFNAAISPIWGTWMVIFAWFGRLQYFFSGVFFIPDNLPPAARYFISWNPLAHSIIWVREGFYDGYVSIILDKTYPFLVAIVLAISGLAIEFVFRRKVDAK